MSGTMFPTQPREVAVLTPAEFEFDADWNDTPSLEAVCRRFANDANRALVWFIRFRALKAWLARDAMPRSLNAGGRRARDICEVAARFDLNDRLEFDDDAFRWAVDDLARRRTAARPD
jgi:hypothetical protein